MPALPIARTNAYVVSAAALLSVVSVVEAQEAQEALVSEQTFAANDQSRSHSGGIESVTVTARRREENVQDVPIPIATLGGDALEGAGKFRLEDLNQKLPSTNVQFSNPRQTSIAVRGLGNNPANDALESSVGVYLDNVYLGRPGMANLDLIDIEQVSLLRGPQGTLFGKNTTAGVLNIATRAPDFTPEGRAEASYGDYGGADYYQVRAAYAGPIASDVLAGRISFAKTSRDGYIDDVTDGRKLNGSEREGVRGQLLYKPADTFSVRVIGDYNEENSPCCASVLYSPGPNNGALYYQRVAAAGGNVVYDPDYRTSTLDTHQYMKVRQGGGSIEANATLGDYSLTSITAYRSWWFRPTNDADGISIPAIINGGQLVDDEQWSQELRLASADGQSLEWVAGLFYFHQSQDNRFYTQYGPAAGAYLGSPVLNNALTETRQQLGTDSVSAFAQATWHVNDRWDLTAGLRQTMEDKDTRVIRDPATGGPNVHLAFPVYDSGKLELSDDNLSALFSVGYSFTDQVLGYASVSQGAKSGGINPSVPAAALGTDSLFIDSEEATDVELGVKSTLLDDALVLNVNAFWTRVEDYQATQIAETAPGVFTQLLSNVGLVRTRGVEAEVTAVPVDGLTLALAASYNDATYLSYSDAPCSAEAAVAGATVCDLSGQDVVGAPKWIVNPGASYRRDLVSGVTGYGSFEYAWRSDFFGSPDNSEFARVDSYGLLNVRLGLNADWGGNTWDVSVWANNVLDERYVIGGLGAGQFRSYFQAPGAPRAIGATVRVEF